MQLRVYVAVRTTPRAHLKSGMPAAISAGHRSAPSAEPALGPFPFPLSGLWPSHPVASEAASAGQYADLSRARSTDLGIPSPATGWGLNPKARTLNPKPRVPLSGSCSDSLCLQSHVNSAAEATGQNKKG